MRLHAQSSLVSASALCASCSSRFQMKHDVRSGGGGACSPRCTASNLRHKRPQLDVPRRAHLLCMQAVAQIRHAPFKQACVDKIQSPAKRM